MFRPALAFTIIALTLGSLRAPALEMSVDEAQLEAREAITQLQKLYLESLEAQSDTLERLVKAYQNPPKSEEERQNAIEFWQKRANETRTAKAANEIALHRQLQSLKINQIEFKSCSPTRNKVSE